MPGPSGKWPRILRGITSSSRGEDRPREEVFGLHNKSRCGACVSGTMMAASEIDDQSADQVICDACDLPFPDDAGLRAHLRTKGSRCRRTLQRRRKRKENSGHPAIWGGDRSAVRPHAAGGHWESGVGSLPGAARPGEATVSDPDAAAEEPPRSRQRLGVLTGAAQRALLCISFLPASFDTRALVS